MVQNQLFHPFSQENPLQSGTGLGLAIVNSIIRSDSVNGHVDVSSTEGVGTEIRITFDATVPDDEQSLDTEKIESQGPLPSVSMIGFDDATKGTALLRDVIGKYLSSWWGFEIVPTSSESVGDILVLNEDATMISDAVTQKDTSRPFVLLTSSRADTEVMGIVYDFERMGGFCRVVAKPVGPSRLRQVVKACVHMINFRESQRTTPHSSTPGSARSSTLPSFQPYSPEPGLPMAGMSRRTSQDSQHPSRPRILPRAHTFHPTLPTARTSSPSLSSAPSAQEYPSSPGDTTITVGVGGTLLKTSIGSLERQGRVRVLVVEDNQILRDLLYVTYCYRAANVLISSLLTQGSLA